MLGKGKGVSIKNELPTGSHATERSNKMSSGKISGAFNHLGTGAIRSHNEAD